MITRSRLSHSNHDFRSSEDQGVRSKMWVGTSPPCTRRSSSPTNSSADWQPEVERGATVLPPPQSNRSGMKPESVRLFPKTATRNGASRGNKATLPIAASFASEMISAPGRMKGRLDETTVKQPQSTVKSEIRLAPFTATRKKSPRLAAVGPSAAEVAPPSRHANTPRSSLEAKRVTPNVLPRIIPRRLGADRAHICGPSVQKCCNPLSLSLNLPIACSTGQSLS